MTLTGKIVEISRKTLYTSISLTSHALARGIVLLADAGIVLDLTLDRGDRSCGHPVRLGDEQRPRYRRANRSRISSTRSEVYHHEHGHVRYRVSALVDQLVEILIVSLICRISLSSS
jgi:hypothetical protein